jgi:peptidoglycan-associated lipoprotein
MKFRNLVLAVMVAGSVAACKSDDQDRLAGGAGGANGGADGGGYQGAPVGGVQGGDLQSETQELKTQVGDTIHFALNSSDVEGEARAILERQSAFMRKYQNLTFTIEGHCDERGTREFNLALGERRATAAKNALISLGVSTQRLTTISYGKERPVAVGSNEAAWAQNRRAVTVIN